MSVKNQPVRLPEKLRAAIACLDLSLESELALYRNHQSQASSALALPSADPDEAALRSPDLALEAFIATDDPKMFPNEGADDYAEAEVQEIDLATAAVEIEDESETLPEPYGAELTAQPKAFDQFLDPSIEAYLESSEALLKHLDEPADDDSAPAQKPATSSKQSWVVGSGLILIVLGMLALAGFFVFVAQRWFSTKSSIAPVTPQPLVSPTTQSAPSPSLSPLSNQSLSPLPNAAIASSSGAVTHQESATEGISSNPTETGAVTPQPSATPTSINPNAANYIVLAANSSAETLQTAQRLVPDAFVTNVGGQRRIQLGSLDSLRQAQQMVNELKNQGFPASIVAQN